MSNLLMDLTTGDLDFSTGTLQIVTSRNACAQRLRNAFEIALGEWFLDTRQGVPYIEIIFEMGTPKLVISRIFQDVILRDKEISNILDFDFVVDRQARSGAFTFNAQTINGELLDFTVEPLIIDFSKVLRS